VNEDSDNSLRALALREHLPYELDMLEHAFAFLNKDENSKMLGSHTLIKNAFIEVFWLHARNLLEFLTQPENKTGVSPRGTVSAEDFTAGFESEPKMKEMLDRINNAVTHLQYGRPSSVPEGKLGGYEMSRVKETIDREISRFEKHLKSEYLNVWTPRTGSPAWVSTLPVLNSTSTMTMVSLTIDYGRR
jgi:hypothetical protein